jgi:hypothetical protein
MTSESPVPAYPIILEAYNLIDNGELDEAVLESAMWRQENGIWSVHAVRKMDEPV